MATWLLPYPRSFLAIAEENLTPRSEDHSWKIYPPDLSRLPWEVICYEVMLCGRTEWYPWGEEVVCVITTKPLNSALGMKNFQLLCVCVCEEPTCSSLFFKSVLDFPGYWLRKHFDEREKQVQLLQMMKTQALTITDPIVQQKRQIWYK